MYPQLTLVSTQWFIQTHCSTIFSVHAHFKLEDGSKLGRVTCSPSETDENFNDVPVTGYYNAISKNWIKCSAEGIGAKYVLQVLVLFYLN